MEEKISDHHYRLQSQLVGQRFAGASLSALAIGTDVAAKIAEWLKKKKGFLVFLGSPGIGKTYFCSALLPWIDGKFNTYRYWRERDFLSRLRETMGQNGDYITAIPLLMDDEFVMIDDVGSSGFNEWRSEVLFALIDTRYESGYATVFTSNLTRQKLEEGIGARAASRLFAKENLIIEIHEGQDLRKNGM